MLYIDSADREEIAPLLETGLFAGVTTNPTILSRAGLGADDVPALAEWVRAHGASRFFAQPTGGSVDAIRRGAARIAELGDDVVVKVVSTHEGLTVARELADAGREVLVTAIYHPAQMLTAQAAGVRFIAPYVGRAGEAGRDGVRLVERMAAMGGVGDVRILAASLRSVDALADVAAAGAHDATLAPAVARALLADDLTMAAHAEFEAVAGG